MFQGGINTHALYLLHAFSPLPPACKEECCWNPNPHAKYMLAGYVRAT